MFCVNNKLWICFPVWRELKLMLIASGDVSFLLLWICFPVWRELKLHTQKTAKRIKLLWICFPVWRELKRTKSIRREQQCDLWICFPVWRELKLEPLIIPPQRAIFTLDMLSRLKGIETFIYHRRNECRLIFGYAFPFEGNWNCPTPAPRYPHSESALWICFPVWRELKP